MTEQQQEQEADFYLGDWLVRPTQNRIERGDLVQQLQPLSMRLLTHLAQHAGEVVPNEALLERFWEGRIVADDAIHRRISDIRQQLGDDARNPCYIETISKKGYRVVAAVGHPDPQAQSTGPKRRYTVYSALAAALVIGILAVWWPGTGTTHRAAVERAEQLVTEGRLAEAYQAIEPWLDQDDPAIQSLIETITVIGNVRTDPADATVRYRLVGSEIWHDLGSSQDGARLPQGVLELNIDAPGYHSAHLVEPNPGVRFNNVPRDPFTIRLVSNLKTPPGTVFVPAGIHDIGVWGVEQPLDLKDFFIDQMETTNAEYAEFVAAGGYQDPRYWQDGVPLATLASKLVDATGRPGPAAWAFGTYPAGEAELPVTGVSWFEAMAYARFRNRTLPSVFHWGRAALAHVEWKWPVAGALVPRANLATEALLAATGPAQIESHGTIHMIGNAREWTRTEGDQSRFIIGGSWRDPSWAYNVPMPVDPRDRSATNGFRTIVEREQPVLPPPGLGWLGTPVTPRVVSDERFEEIRHRYAYRPGTVSADDAARVSTVDQGQWLRKLVHLPSGDPADPLPVYIYMPKSRAAPLQSLIFLPPADSFSPNLVSEEIDIAAYHLDFIPLGGRALIWPVYLGTHERYQAIGDLSREEQARWYRDRFIRRRDEFGRVIDYLSDHPEFDGEKVGLLALSLSATYSAAQMLATEPRLKVAALLAVGLASPSPLVHPDADPNIYWPRVTQPVLLANGRWDVNRPPHVSFDPLVALIGTPAAAKRVILYEDAGHWPLPPLPMARDTLAWLDERLGPISEPVTAVARYNPSVSSPPKRPAIPVSAGSLASRPTTE